MIINNIENINRFEKLGVLIDQLYSLYERIHIVPNMQFSEDSPMSSPLLKYRLDKTFSTILQRLLPTSVKQLQNDYYIYIYEQFFALTSDEKEKEEEGDDEKEEEDGDDLSMNEKENNYNNKNIFTPRQYTKNYHYKENTLIWILSQNLDEDLPELVDVFNIPDKLLQNLVTNAINNYLDVDHINTSSYGINGSTSLENSSDQQQQSQNDNENIINNNSNIYNDNDNDNNNNTKNNYDDIEMISTDSATNSLSRFIDICQKSYIIRLIPSLENMIEKWLHERFSGIWKEEWTRNVLQLQLNWFRCTVLPWLSHILAPPPSFTPSGIVIDIS